MTATVWSKLTAAVCNKQAAAVCSKQAAAVCNKQAAIVCSKQAATKSEKSNLHTKNAQAARLQQTMSRKVAATKSRKVAATKSHKVAATKSRKVAATKSSKTNLHTKNSQAATMPQLDAAAKPHACCLFAAILCEKPFNSIRVGVTASAYKKRTSRKVAATKSRKVAATKSSKTNLHTKNSQAATMPQLAAAAKPHACCLFAAILCEKPLISIRELALESAEEGNYFFTNECAGRRLDCRTTVCDADKLQAELPRPGLHCYTMI